MKRKWVLRLVFLCFGTMAILGAMAVFFWVCLEQEPAFYQSRVVESGRREAEAREFLDRGIQLQNDVRNEETWEAVFSEAEVNAWISEELGGGLLGVLPPGLKDARVAFEPDRVSVGWRMEEGSLGAVVWAVLQVRARGNNELEVTVERVRAGALPVPWSGYMDQITREAQKYGVGVKWERDEQGLYKALVEYKGRVGSRAFGLDLVQIRPGQVRFRGWSSGGGQPGSREGLSSARFQRNVQLRPR